VRLKVYTRVVEHQTHTINVEAPDEFPTTQPDVEELCEPVWTSAADDADWEQNEVVRVDIIHDNGETTTLWDKETTGV